MGGALPGGLSVKGISGGEARRLHISCGIISAPSIIFIDEPTSGAPCLPALLASLACPGRLACLRVFFRALGSFSSCLRHLLQEKKARPQVD